MNVYEMYRLFFTAVGCSNPVPPAESFVERQGDRALIICESTDSKWEIICNDGEWQGDVGDCSKSKVMHTHKHYMKHFAIPGKNSFMKYA